MSLPYGVTKETMSFSWVNSLKNGVHDQEAYRIVIALRREGLNSKNYVYDSKWTVSNQNTSVLLDLSAVLKDNELYYWQVQIRNEIGRESNMSEPQAFSTAVGGQWASRQGLWGTPEQKVVFLRQSIQKTDNVEKAIISVTATSTMGSRQYVYNLYVNGKELGIGPTRQNGNILYYNTYDITDELMEGSNVIGAICYSEDSAAFLCQITYYMTDGSQIIVGNSGRDIESWNVLNGDPIYLGSNSQSIGTNYYKARQDNVNAEIFPFEWSTVGYPANDWIQPVKSNVIEDCSL